MWARCLIGGAHAAPGWPIWPASGDREPVVGIDGAAGTSRQRACHILEQLAVGELGGRGAAVRCGCDGHGPELRRGIGPAHRQDG
jgi:hypothetical protein